MHQTCFAEPNSLQLIAIILVMPHFLKLFCVTVDLKSFLVHMFNTLTIYIVNKKEKILLYCMYL